MEKLQIVIEDVSEEQIQRDIERMTKGWRLFFIEPADVEYEFFNTFWGYPWNGTPEDLKDAICSIARVDGKVKQHICTFVLDGQERFAWCSWTREVYDFKTKIKHQLDNGQLAMKITNLINELI